MEGQFKLEQIWRWRHVNNEEDPLLYFADSETVQEAEIDEIADPADDITLDDVEWLLLPYRGHFRLFVRDYQGPEVQPPANNELKEPYLDLLRYEPPANLGAGDTIWRLMQVEDLDDMSAYYKSRWKKRAILAIRKGDNAGEHKLQVLCPPPFAPVAGYCEAYCCPPQDSKHKKLCKMRKCPPCP